MASTFPQDLKYSETHEWARPDGAEVVVGITTFAVEQLQDLVFIELPQPGAKVERGKRFGEIESVKAVSDLNSPVSGTIVAVNDALRKSLDPLTKDAHGGGWLIRVKPDGALDQALAGLLDAAAYGKLAAEGHH
jgi:glycine cleavage system H protein